MARGRRPAPRQSHWQSHKRGSVKSKAEYRLFAVPRLSRGRRREIDLRLALGFIADFDVGPVEPFPPGGPQAFQDRFLGGPATGKVLRRALRAWQ